MNKHRLAGLAAVVLMLTLGGAAVPAWADADNAVDRPVLDGSHPVKRRAVEPAGAGDVPQAVPTASPSLFVPITPYRMYDSRFEPQPWVAGEYSDIDALTDIDSVPQIPNNATAVAFNVTAVSLAGQGFVQILAPGGVQGSTSTVNFTGPGLVVANGGSVGLVGGKLQVFVGGAGGARTDVIIDVAGYYVTPV